MLRRITKIGFGTLLGALLLAQFFQPERTNPVSDAAYSFKVVAHPTPDVQAIVNRACHDCHSNETVWPLYSAIAPASWLIVRDVQEGRAHLNLSEWKLLGPERTHRRLREMCEQVRSREMPPWYYVSFHPSAKLNENDASTLCMARTSGDAVPLACGFGHHRAIPFNEL
jgi:hypothetical protein